MKKMSFLLASLFLLTSCNQQIYSLIKVLERPGTSVKAPEYSHTENRIYAIMQKGELKHIAFYNDKHELVKSIDFQHYHDGMKPHVHHDVYHKGAVTSMTPGEQHVYEQVASWLKTNK